MRGTRCRILWHSRSAAPSPHFRNQDIVQIGSNDTSVAAGSHQNKTDEKDQRACFHAQLRYFWPYTDSMVFLACFSQSESGLAMHTH